MAKRFLIIFLALLGLLQAEEIKLSDTLKKVIPAVVSIYAVDYKNPQAVQVFFSSSVQDGSTGSGVIITIDGLIITNYHVVKGKPYIKVVLNDRRAFQARLLNYDPSIDLAILKIDLKDNRINPVSIISSKDILVGDPVLAIGNPFGIGISVSTGIVSALPSKDNLGIGNLIQTDALLNPGNSGGALIDTKGNLIGINTFIFGNKGASSGIGFAIPSDLVKLFIDRSLSGKKIKQYWLGLSGINVNDEIAKKVGLEIPEGILVTEIYNKGPAQSAGLKLGDVILQFGDTKVNAISALSFIVASLENDSPQDLQILRGGKVEHIAIKPEIPSENIPSEKTLIEKGVFEGIIVANNSHAVAYELGSSPRSEGVIIYDIPDKSNIAKSFPSVYSAMKGSMIVSINGQKIANVKEMLGFIEKNKDILSYKVVLRRYNNEIEFNMRRSE